MKNVRKMRNVCAQEFFRRQTKRMSTNIALDWRRGLFAFSMQQQQQKLSIERTKKSRTYKKKKKSLRFFSVACFLLSSSVGFNAIEIDKSWLHWTTRINESQSEDSTRRYVGRTWLECTLIFCRWHSGQVLTMATTVPSMTTTFDILRQFATWRTFRPTPRMQ